MTHPHDLCPVSTVFCFFFLSYDLVHCDDKHTCPKGTTCCNSGNGWGCCPLPQVSTVLQTPA
uniref:Granulins domain-containing protein n=1 Tax=Neogobius melanostomus TaxID=47308 RepID=A0A8C6WXJ3_9GOBI